MTLTAPAADNTMTHGAALLVGGPLDESSAARLAPVFKALGDPVRLRLLSIVSSHPEGEVCVCDIAEAFDLSTPTISHHLRVLHETGLVSRQRRGTWIFYRVRHEALAEIASLLAAPVPAIDE